MNLNNVAAQLTQRDWINVLLSLSPVGIKTLEETLRRVRQLIPDQQPEVFQESGAIQLGQESPPAVSSSSTQQQNPLKLESASPLSSPSSTTSSSQLQRPGKTLENGRRKLKDEKVSDQEADRRSKRRERNRLAAAKCRRRRQDQIETLQERVTGLQNAGRDLQDSLRDLTKEKQRLERILEDHGCVLTNHSRSNQSEVGPTSKTTHPAPKTLPPRKQPSPRAAAIAMENAEAAAAAAAAAAAKGTSTAGDSKPHHSLAPLIIRPSSLPLPPGPAEPTAPSSTAALTRLSPLITPSTLQFLSQHGAGLLSATSAAGAPLDVAQMFNSIEYLNLLSPGITISSLNQLLGGGGNTPSPFPSSLFTPTLLGLQSATSSL